MLFSEKIADAQRDSALRSLTMVYKDIRQADFSVQTVESDIDHDLINEMKFYK